VNAQKRCWRRPTLPDEAAEVTPYRSRRLPSGTWRRSTIFLRARVPVGESKLQASRSLLPDLRRPMPAFLFKLETDDGTPAALPSLTPPYRTGGLATRSTRGAEHARGQGRARLGERAHLWD